MLQHKLSMATTGSSTSATSGVSGASSSRRARTGTGGGDREGRIPVYVRLVPKDVWLRMHVSATQTVGAIKDAALHKINAPDHDPSLSYRFYQDALTAATHAKLAPVAGHDRVLKTRTFSLPRTFISPAPDLTDASTAVAAALAAAKARTTKAKRAEITTAMATGRGVSSSTMTLSPPASELGMASRMAASSGSNATSHEGEGEDEWAIRLDPRLIRGDRDAKLEEQLASLRLAQWTASRTSTLRSPSHSIASTPTIGSSLVSTDRSVSAGSAGSPWLASPHEPRAFYAQSGADSMDSLASTGSDEAGLVTTADDDASLMQWGTQAERSPLSSPRHPPAAASAMVEVAASPTRPRSRTVTAADVLRSRGEADEIPPVPETVSSPVRKSSLPKVSAALPTRRLVAESSQRRAVHTDLLDLLRGSADDDDPVRRAAKPLGETVRRTSSSGSVSAWGDGVSYASPTPSAGAGLRWDEPTRPNETAHPLSPKLTLISAANGCELEEWKTAGSYGVRPFELLELHWAIPTERVYLAPVRTAELVRAPRAGKEAPRSPQRGGGWTNAVDVGPEADAACLDAYFEGWVYVLKAGAVGKDRTRAKAAKWKLHWITVKGWRVDVYRKKPRAGEAVLPVAEHVWPLRALEWVLENDNPVAVNAALPALEAVPSTSLTLSLAVGEGVVTVRCISRFDHEALSTLLVRAWYRSASAGGGDVWRRKALFRSLVAGRGGTVAPGRAGRGRGSRNAKARMRLRPSGWSSEWEDADQWSSDSERETLEPPRELEAVLQQRRDTITQLAVDTPLKRRKNEGEERTVVPNGLYAALLGRSSAPTPTASAEGEAKSSDSSPYHQASSYGGARQRNVQSPTMAYAEPGLMLGSHAVDRRAVSRPRAEAMGRQRSGSLTRSGESADTAAGSGPRSRSLTVSSPGSKSRGRSNEASDSTGSRSVSRDASPRPGRGSGATTPRDNAPLYPMAPALAPGFVDVPPPASLLVLKKYKASQSTKP